MVRVKGKDCGSDGEKRTERQRERGMERNVEILTLKPTILIVGLNSDIVNIHFIGEV